MAATEAKRAPSFMIVGKTGWIGQKLGELLTAQGKTWRFLDARMESRDAVARELDEHKPTHVLNAAGVTGRPNVDWCEDHKQETIRANVIGLLNLCDLTHARGIHLTNFATGCIYSYDAAHPIGGKTFTEDDPPNFDGSFYSLTKGLVERMVRETYPNVLVLRLRMPISDDLNPRNFITKITRYAKVVDIPNSMTILHDMLPIGIKAAERGLTGVYNFTNPGAISHNQILALYKKYINPDFKWTNFSEEEQNLILKAKRSNNELNTSKLEAAFPEMKDLNVHKAIVGVFERMKVNLDREAKEAAAKAGGSASGAAGAGAGAGASVSASGSASGAASTAARVAAAIPAVSVSAGLGVRL
jgi:dTDP-4-dehydrorhamnose reductase